MTNEEALEVMEKYHSPLTLEGVKERIAVWVEDRLSVMDNLVPALYVYNDETTYVFDEGFGVHDYHREDNYGETWRCWERKPTEEERTTAKWNDWNEGDSE